MSRVAEAVAAASYKKLKEDFVSNLSGGAVSEINYVTTVAPAAVALWSALQTRQSLSTPYTALSFAVDFLLNVAAILLATTLHANNPLLLNLFLLAPVPLLYLLPGLPATSTKSSRSKRLPPTIKEKTELNPLPKKPFLTSYRGAMMVITCIAILAVDFRIFPRRFAKVENWGTSLMDVGVGSFVFSAGLVASRSILKEQLSGKSSNLLPRLYASFRHSLPLIVLGFVRLWSVKGLDYAEHVTEYGVHWNFFFTLGFLPPFVAVSQTLFSWIPSYAALAMLLGSAYQLLLSTTNLTGYMLTAPRINLLSQNREGIFSFVGYLAIFLAGQSAGMFVLPRSLVKSKDGWEQRKRLLLTLGGWSFVWTVLFYASTSYSILNLSVSRRLANLPYFLWISSFNHVQLLLFLLAETVFCPQTIKAPSSEKVEDDVYKTVTSGILEAFNRNGLAIFLLANLGTGAVNLGVKTLWVRDEAAVGILLIYAGLLTGVAVGLDYLDISLKM